MLGSAKFGQDESTTKLSKMVSLGSLEPQEQRFWLKLAAPWNILFNVLALDTSQFEILLLNKLAS